MLSRSNSVHPKVGIGRGARCNLARRRGFTLGELLVASAVAGILMVGMGSAVMFSLEAGDVVGSSIDMSSQATNVLDRLTRDLGDALSILERSSTSVAFTVPDRNGDGIPEMIRYAWAGVAGAPLTYAYNGSAAVTLAANVHHFDLDFLLRTIGPPKGACCLSDGTCIEDTQDNCDAEPGTLYQGDDTTCDTVQCPVESDELLLMAHDDAPGGTLHNFGIATSGWAGTFFAPTLPVNTTSWKITRIQLRAQANGDLDGVAQLQIRTADGALQPTGTVLDEATLSEASLAGTYTWVDIPFGPLKGLDPAQALCVVVTAVSGTGNIVRIEYEKNDNPMTANAHWVQSGDSGVSWNTVANNDLRFILYGTVTTKGPPQWP